MPAEPGEAADVEAARREVNARHVRLLSSATAVVHLVSIAVFVGLQATTPDQERWRENLIGLHVLGLGVSLILRAATGGRAGSRWLAPVQQHAGEWLLTYATVFGTAVTVNSRLSSFTLTPWLIASLIGALATYTRARLAVSLHGAAMVVAVTACLAAASDAGVRAGLLVNALAFGALGFVLSRVTFGAFVREVGARRSLETARQGLEERVQSQVGDIVAKAQRIEALNKQLASQVQARSAELSLALERLVAVQHGEETMDPGRVIASRFEIRRLLGVGGMGVVYAAHDRTGDVEVALKVVNRAHASGDTARRFLREASAAARVVHPAIVRVLHLDVTDEGELYQVQELVDGLPLDAWTTPGRKLPPAMVARLGATLASALATAHAQDIVHRDVKPQNIMLTRDEPGCRLLDFGLAKRLEEPGEQLTEHGRVVGTPQFLAPEQVSAPAQAGRPVDVYALGVTLYLALAGHLPYRARGAADWLRAHAFDLPLPLVDTPVALAEIVMACLAKQPQERPTAAEVAERLDAQARTHGEVSLVRWFLDECEMRTRDLTAHLPNPAARTATTRVDALTVS
jgi:hypothetical protein